MAASGKDGSGCWGVPVVYKHHEQSRVCISRPKYREGRKARAVKVYTINLESRYIMVQGVPAIGVMSELIQLCALYGVVEEYRPLDEYPAEEFTEVYLVKFQKLTSARAAKRHMDEKSFYGGVLHVCYVPEYETVEDTRQKLQDRRRYVIKATQNKAREKKRKEAENEQATSSDTASSSETVAARRDITTETDEAGNPSNMSQYVEFPPLPLPPQEHYNYGQIKQFTKPTEDNMGTSHNAIINKKERPRPSSSHTSSDRDSGHRLASNHCPAVRFLPRTTHLENRKRKIEEAMENSTSDDTSSNEPLIGPKLPELAKVDMEDESLNTTVHLIRNTMKQVGAVSDLKPVDKKVKPRRRI
ncbi:RNA-binding protein 48 [Cheilinus undulatus]|uniref:RNA-binding protein 48 n=1 Tax=Cheilinus undulatus TaxID=241271 RepID=UPI001BD5F670|nr:RNA-binding protein 48 [Cheilinus undulatus]